MHLDLIIDKKLHRFFIYDVLGIINNPIFDIEDIAQYLSRIYRYNNLTRRNYSVALHSVNMAGWYMYRYAENKTEQERILDILAILLHDCAEFIVGDLSKPIKDNAVKGFDKLEEHFKCWLVNGINLDYKTLFEDIGRVKLVNRCDYEIFQQEALAFGVDFGDLREHHIKYEEAVSHREKFKLILAPENTDNVVSDTYVYLQWFKCSEALTI